MKRLLIYLLCMIASLGCSHDSLGGNGDNDFGYVSKPSTILYIYGGKNEEDYLGIPIYLV